eukprot:scaffold336_cov196-Amphora_coffeaeformis.AAC.11
MMGENGIIRGNNNNISRGPERFASRNDEGCGVCMARKEKKGWLVGCRRLTHTHTHTHTACGVRASFVEEWLATDILYNLLIYRQQENVHRTNPHTEKMEFRGLVYLLLLLAS